MSSRASDARGVSIEGAEPAATVPSADGSTSERLDPASVKANYQLGLLLTRMGRKDEAAKQLEVAKGLRKELEASSRLQLRLLDPDQIVDRQP